jgi:hypothetical protein
MLLHVSLLRHLGDIWIHHRQAWRWLGGLWEAGISRILLILRVHGDR